jgi:hypothetical protein
MKASLPSEPTPDEAWMNEQLEAAMAAIPPDRLAAHLVQAGKFIAAILDDDYAEASNVADDLESSIFTGPNMWADFLRLEALFTRYLEKTEKEDLVRLKLKLRVSRRTHSHEALQNVVKRAVDKLPKPERKEIERKIRTEMTSKDPEEKVRDDRDDKDLI